MKHNAYALTLTALLLTAPFITGNVSAAQPAFSVGFSPSHTALAVVLDEINHAQHSLDVEAYSFTSKEIAEALVSAQKRGVKVRVMADEKANSGKYSAVTFLANQHVPVRLNGNYAIMHNKVTIVDGITVETGSFNYTSSADKRNAENALVIRNQPQLAAVYQQEFERLWQESTPKDASY